MRLWRPPSLLFSSAGSVHQVLSRQGKVQFWGWVALVYSRCDKTQPVQEWQKAGIYQPASFPDIAVYINVSWTQVKVWALVYRMVEHSPTSSMGCMRGKASVPSPSVDFFFTFTLITQSICSIYKASVTSVSKCCY